MVVFVVVMKTERVITLFLRINKMKGDKHKPKSRFSRWIDAFYDGSKTPDKPHYRVPSMTDGKRYTKRWRRRLEKRDLKDLDD